MSWSSPSIAAIQVEGRSAGCAPNGMTSQAVVWVPPGEDGLPPPESVVEALRCHTPEPEGLARILTDVVWSGDEYHTLRIYNPEPKEFVSADRALTFADMGPSDPTDPTGARESCAAEDLTTFQPYTDVGDACPAFDADAFAFEDDRGHVQFLDAKIVRGENGYPTAEFWLEPADSRCGSMLRSTCVPRFRQFAEFCYRTNNYATGITSVEQGAAVVYANGTEVLRLPDGTWMMLLQAWITIVDESVFATLTTDTIMSWSPPSCASTDIICYFADDAAFRAGLVGPFRVVSGRNAVPDAADVEATGDRADYPTTMLLKPRLTIGTPSGVVKGDCLYVYYAVDASFNYDDRLGELDSKGDPLNGECPPNTLGGDVAMTDSSSLERDSRDAYTSNVGSEFAGLAVKRISLDTIEDLLSDVRGGAPVLSQDSWEAPVRSVEARFHLRGELLGRVRVWVPRRPEFPGSGVWIPALQIFDRALTTCPRGVKIDAVGAYCDAADDLVLYFSFGPCEDYGLGGGIWRSQEYSLPRAFDADTRELLPVVEGRDFFTRMEWSYSHDGELLFTSADHVVDGSSDGEFQNSDVIKMRDGYGWRVYAGGGYSNTFTRRDTGGGASLGTLHVITGDEEDGCTV